MSEMMSALSELRAQLLHLNFPVLSETEATKTLSKLSRLAEEMKLRTPRISTSTGLTPEAVWSKWKDDQFDPETLTRREWRTLCGAPSTAIRRELIECLRTHSEPLGRLANVLGIATAYFRYWIPEEASMADAPTIERLLLRELEGRYSTSKNRVIQAWRRYPQFFSPQAAEWIAKNAVHHQRSITAIIKGFYIEPTSQLAGKSLEAAARQATSSLVKSPASSSESSIVSQFEWAFSTLFISELSPGTYRKCICDIILSALPNRYPALRQSLVHAISDDPRLGDPRLIENGPNWRELPNEPREVFLSWLAERYIQLFFDIVVPKSDENRRRADFWLNYAKRKGNVKDFQVAVSEQDLFKVQRSQETKAFSYARVSKETNASSAFLMEFHGHGERYIIVEFSETGYAACIYRKSDFEDKGISLRHRSFSISNLRNTSLRVDSINHYMGDWESKARNKLRQIGVVQ